MSNPSGTIQSLLSATRVVVEVDVSEVCPRCAAGKGCGAGLLGGGKQRRQVEAAVDTRVSLAEGDRVELILAADNLLRAALIVYGLPLLGAIVAASLAYLLALGDAAAAVAAIGGVSLGLLVSRQHLRRTACLENFVPRVERRL